MAKVGLVNDGAALLSMRNSDFDAYSAIGEVIDNSLQADAKKVCLQVDYQVNQQEPITLIAFGDNGGGMTTDILHHCLQLGYSSRYNDRSGIGRFGVGATLGAINQCKRIDLYSKVAGGKWLYTFVDLDMVTSVPPKMEEIPTPVAKDPPEKFGGLIGKDYGTLVLWSKYDRQPERGAKLIEELKIWVGRTYRHFIWDGVEIRINGELVRAIDPLYVTTALSKFPDDPPAHEYQPMEIEWPIAAEDRQPGGPTHSKIRIRMSLLPEQFRPKIGSGNSSESLKRYIDRNEGISILRNRREVLYDHIPYWHGGFKEIDRWWGCEVSFDAVLDSQFAVKNIKRGAVPVRELKEAIRATITPTRATALERVRAVWAKAEAEERQRSDDQGVDTGHSDAERAAKETPTARNLIDKSKQVDDEARKLADQVLENADAKQKALWRAKFQSQPFTILDSEWKGPEFVETNHLGGVDVLRYNMQHPFFSEIHSIREELSGDSDEAPAARRLSALIDLLLISYSKAEAMFEKDLQLKADKFIEQLRMSWGNYLNNYIETWKGHNEGAE